MGKPHQKRKKRTKPSQNSGNLEIGQEEKNASGNTSPDINIVDKLLSQAESCINNFEYDAAKKCCESVLEQDPNNLQALDMLSGATLELGDVQTAKQVLLRATELSPDVGYTKYLCLGQLAEGAEALGYYRQGITIVKKELDASNGKAAKAEKRSLLQKELSRAYCAMAEIYMTDCCFEDDAETQCGTLVDKALQADPSNPEAFQSRASLLVTTGDIEGAKQAMKQSLSLWLPQYQASREGDADVDGIEACLPEYETRIAAAKLLIELEMENEASDVLDGLVEEDDEHPIAWYLLGWSNYLRGEDCRGNARYYLTQTKQVAAKVLFDDAEILAHVDELLAELGPDDEDDDKENISAPGNDSFDSDDAAPQMEQ